MITHQPSPSADLYENVHHCLLHDWDPIGVRHYPEAYDEYESYVRGVCKLLLGGADESKLRRHLAHIETVDMGLSATSSNLDAVVRKLLHMVGR